MSAARRWQSAAWAYAGLLGVISVIPVAPKSAPGYFDKVAHLCEYLVFAWLLVRVFGSAGRPVLWTAWWRATAYGAVLEAVQAFVPWRSAELMDGLTNAAGAALGVWIARRIPGKS